MRESESTSGETTAPDGGWINSDIGHALFHRRHAVSIMLVLYKRGELDTSELVREVRGHTMAVIEALRTLELLGIIRREPIARGRRRVLQRLTARGLMLVESPLLGWGRALGKA